MAKYLTQHFEQSSELGENITPSDSTDLDYNTREIRIGTGGTLKVKFVSGGSIVTIPANIAYTGAVLNIAVDRIYDTDTTASEILALY